MGTDFNRDNLLLFINEPKTMAGYEIEYRSENLEFRNKSGYVRKNDIEPTADPYRVVASKDIIYQGEKYLMLKTLSRSTQRIHFMKLKCAEMEK